MKKFMLFDILIFTILAVLSEWVGKLINENFMYISLIQVFALLMIVRWKYYSAIPITIIALFRIIIYQPEGFKEILVYTLPVLVLFSLIFFHKEKHLENLNKLKSFTLLYFSLGYILFFLTNGILIKTLISNEYSFLNEIPKYLFSFIVGNIVMVLLQGQKTMLVDVVSYYKKIAKERELNGN